MYSNAKQSIKSFKVSSSKGITSEIVGELSFIFSNSLGLVTLDSFQHLHLDQEHKICTKRANMLHTVLNRFDGTESLKIFDDHKSVLLYTHSGCFQLGFIFHFFPESNKLRGEIKRRERSTSR